MTTKDDLIARIKNVAPELREHSVQAIWLFGSVARDQATPASDVDVLVEFSGPVTIFEFIRLRRRLEAVLGRTVDLVTREALKPQLRDRILSEAVRAA